MNFYRKHLFLPLAEWILRSERFRHLRKELLQDLEEPALEIGFGTGLNIEEIYPRVEELFALDPNPGMHALSAKNLRRSRTRVHWIEGMAEVLPFPNASFASIISSWTLCSVADLDQSLSEIRRVLRPGGKLFLVEHGQSPEHRVRRWQSRLNPLQKILGGGCHLDRPMGRKVSEAGFQPIRERSFYLKGLPKFGAYTTLGVFLNP